MSVAAVQARLIELMVAVVAVKPVGVVGACESAGTLTNGATEGTPLTMTMNSM